MSSWETSLPPDQPRYFNLDGFDGRTWLVTGEKAPEDIVEDDDFWADSDYDNAAEIAKNLVACWPNSPADVAKVCRDHPAGTSMVHLGKAPLGRHARFDLEDLLGIEYDERMGSYGAGPYVPVAHKPQAIKSPPQCTPPRRAMRRWAAGSATGSR